MDGAYDEWTNAVGYCIVSQTGQELSNFLGGCFRVFEFRVFGRLTVAPFGQAVVGDCRYWAGHL